ncbi:MAG: 4'-phosphopantetheinyl transferase superfamily protein [Gammaproteobacteria bacterium]
MINWQPSTSAPTLDAGEAHIWLVELGTPDSSWTSLAPLLAEDERTKAERFHFARHQRRYILSRAALRILLGRYLGCPPRDIDFNYDTHGKPRLAGLYQRTRFNVSHTEDIMLAAFVLDREIGIDIESINHDIDCMALGRRCFSTLENQTLQSLPEHEHVDAFFRIWSRKEAYIKARGEGMSHPLQAFSVSVDKHAPRLLEHLDDDRETDRWTIIDLEVAKNYRAALVVERPPGQLHYFRLDIPPFDR